MDKFFVFLDILESSNLRRSFFEGIYVSGLGRVGFFGRTWVFLKFRVFMSFIDLFFSRRIVIFIGFRSVGLGSGKSGCNIGKFILDLNYLLVIS